MKGKLLFWFALAVLILTVGCSFFDSGQVNKGSVKVVEVVDGDTIKVQMNGKTETVRLLLVDTPESVHPTKPVQPFSKEASQFTKELLNGADVELELGIGERDKYGRLLAYVYADGKSVQEALLEKGLARVAYIYEPNTKYVDEYQDIQSKAQKEGVGIWSLENYVQEDGYETSDHSTGDKNVSAEECTIKGNINSSGEWIYHVETGRYYKITKPEEWFCTEQEAVEAGFRKSEQ
jgi:micrococcal nuclease